MMTKRDLTRWLEALPDDSHVAINDGGLSLVEVDADGNVTEAYLEVGLTSADD